MGNKKKVLALVTSADRYQKAGYRTGLWLGELSDAYEVLTKAGHQVDVVSVEGGTVPIDPVSVSMPGVKVGNAEKYYAKTDFMGMLDEVPGIDDVDAGAYDALYMAGGHGTMFDFTDARVKDLVARFADEGKIISAVCHGPVALLDVRLRTGKTLLKGRKVTGYSFAEEKAVGRAKVVPFSLEDALQKAGARYEKARLPMGKKVVVDGDLITGQNPTSAKAVAEELVKALKKR